MSQHDREILEAALVGFEHQKAAIDLKIQNITALLRGSHQEVTATTEPGKKQRSKFSVETRKRMAAAQKKRWAARKKLA